MLTNIGIFDWDNKSVYFADRADCGDDPDAVAIPAGPKAALAI